MITLIFISKTKPFVEDIIDNEYVLDIALGVCLFIIVIFIILLINKGISKAVTYTGIGGLDKIFWILFWFYKRLCYFSMYFCNHRYNL